MMDLLAPNGTVSMCDLATLKILKCGCYMTEKTTFGIFVTMQPQN